MRKLACLAAFSLAISAVAACASVHDDDGEGATSTDALTTLTAAQCKTPAVQTTPKKDASGAVIPGSAHTTLSGCIIGAQGETGDAVRTRLTALMGDTARLATVRNAQGAKVFKQLAPGAKHGTLATALTQDINMTLAMDHEPYATLATKQRLLPTGAFTLSISNKTAVQASVAFFTVTVVYPGNLSLSLEVKAQNNGVTVTGASDIILEQSQEQAASASVLVSDLFRWLTSELARTAPPPQPIAQEAGTEGGADAATAPDSASDAFDAATDG